jgi:hypothetical protein
MTLIFNGFATCQLCICSHMSRSMILELDFFVLRLDDFDLQWICNLSTLHLLDI